MNDMASAVAATGWTVPIAFANWPTTDPLRHPNEPNPHEDLVGVDANHVLPTASWPGGTFASYHVYPYYPDFLQYQPSLQHSASSTATTIRTLPMCARCSITTNG